MSNNTVSIPCRRRVAAGTKEPLTKTQTRMVEGETWMNPLRLHPFQECWPCSMALSAAIPNKARHSHILISFGLKTVNGSRLSGYGHPGMPPEAELRETKCSFVVKKVKLVTLICPGRRGHRWLELVSPSPVDTPKPRRTFLSHKSVWTFNRGKGCSELLISLWCMVLNKVAAEESHLSQWGPTDSHLLTWLTDASGFRDPARHAGKSQNPTRYKSIGLNRGWVDLVWISWGLERIGPGLALALCG